jgi:hypothetical protein
MATASKATDTDFRKKWDKEEYAEKARKHDLEEKERMQENEERLKQGLLANFISFLLCCSSYSRQTSAQGQAR